MLIFIVKLAVIAAAIFFAVALGLVASQRPKWSPPEKDSGLDFGDIGGGVPADMPEPLTFTARDGSALPYRRYDSAAPTDLILILVHGSSWHGMQFHDMAKAIAGQGIATVIAPDMRGHGANPVRRGDVDHIGQLEEDVADLIDHLKQGREDARIVLGGHSSGGGFVVRFAGGAYGGKTDGFILMAPFLKHDAPTTRPNAGGWARPAVRRLIGLSMLNAVGIKAFNGLNAISFAMPREVLAGPLGNTATVAYSYRMNASFAPRPDYTKDLGAIRQPLLVMAGAEDESFVAEQYEPVISAQTSTGTYRVLPGVSHLGIVSDEKAIGTVAEWLKSLPG